MIGVGIIGFGRIGAEHAAWLAAARGIRAVAAADITPARQALARERGLAACSDVDDLLADPRVTAVLVSTPTAMHFEHARRALSAGKHVLVEKPMALDLAQGRQLAEEAERRGLVLSVFHNRRWDVDYLTVRQAVASGALGKLINVESRLGQFSSCVGPAAKEYRPNWRNEAHLGGGGLYDWGSHFVDQIWRLMHPAKPLRVFAQLRGNVWSRDCDDFARLLIDFELAASPGGEAAGEAGGVVGGAVALVEINTTTNRPLPRWHLDGTLGSASSPPSALFDTDVWAALEFTPAHGSHTPPHAPPAWAPPEHRVFLKAAPGLSETDLWQRFAGAVRGEGEPAVPVRTVLPTVALLDAARESSRTGKAVDVRDRVEWLY